MILFLYSFSISIDIVINIIKNDISARRQKRGEATRAGRVRSFPISTKFWQTVCIKMMINNAHQIVSTKTNMIILIRKIYAFKM